jgi:aspartate/methionine/tyrosine aminotransferase/GNAT superfamily N-acetyltransferase
MKGCLVMLKKSSAIDRLLKFNSNLANRRFGLPDIGKRNDGDYFNPTVQAIADAIDFYGYEVRDENIVTMPDIDLGGGNPTNYKPFPLSIKKMKDSLDSDKMYKYPYTEGDDNLRKILLDYIESIGFINTAPYNLPDIDKYGLSVHNITFLPSTSIAFNMIINIISKPGDVIIIPGPNYGLFTIRAERSGAEVEILPLKEEDNWKVNPVSLANKIDEINESLQKVYNRRKGYVPRVVAFLNTNPSNPTGKYYGERDADILEEISKVCLERGVFVIDDLVYRDIAYDETNMPKPIASIKGSFRNTISLFGLSKCYGLASLRAGFVVADEIVIREVINRIFQSMDSSPDIVGQALVGAFNTSKERNKIYKEYFTELRDIYQKKYSLLKCLVDGLDSVNNTYKEYASSRIKEIISDDNLYLEVINGLDNVSIPKNLEPEAGFFAIVDFTGLKGKKYKGKTINTERDLLKFFYQTCRIRFLDGQSISWPNEHDLVGRITYALEDDILVNSLVKMHNAIKLLQDKDIYTIRLNELKDQEQMAHIKVDGWRSAYDNIVSSNYLNKLNYEEQTKRYIASFDEYKDLVFVAVKDEEVLGYACFNDLKSNKYDSELISLYIKPNNLNQGIGTSLFLEVAKHLLELNKTNMVVWCFKDNKSARKFYEDLGGSLVEEKNVIIDNITYEEVCYYYDLERLINL